MNGPFTGPALRFANAVCGVRAGGPRYPHFSQSQRRELLCACIRRREEKICLEIDVCHDAHGPCCAHDGDSGN